MAPGTNAGAAHPVTATGQKIEDVMEKKVVSDASAYIRSYTAKRGRNAQLAEGSPAAEEIGDSVLTALQRHPLFLSAALPLRVFPPLFNRYEGGQQFGSHVDNAIRQIAGTGPFELI